MRIGLIGAAGSRVSNSDLAVALIDKKKRPQHHRRRYAIVN